MDQKKITVLIPKMETASKICLTQQQTILPKLRTYVYTLICFY